MELQQREKIAGLALTPAVYISGWVLVSNITILFNKWLIDDVGFTVILVFWHMTFTSMATQILAHTTDWLDGRHKIKMSRRFYLRAVVPIGLLYSGSMVCGNLVYLYLNVAYVQMLKAAAPLFTLLISWLWKQEQPNSLIIMKILVIGFGVLLASAGETRFSALGVLFQLGGLVFESLRVVMIKDLTTDAAVGGMDPLVSLYYYAPVCALANLMVACGTEVWLFSWSDVSRVGVSMLVLNALVAFFLNALSVMLLEKTSAVVSTLCGVLKNILLVIVSVTIWRTAITPLQIFGYGIALVGMVFYRSKWEEVKSGIKLFLHSDRVAASSGKLWEQVYTRSTLRRIILAGVVLLTISGLLFLHSSGEETPERVWRWPWKTVEEEPPQVLFSELL